MSHKRYCYNDKTDEPCDFSFCDMSYEGECIDAGCFCRLKNHYEEQGYCYYSQKTLELLRERFQINEDHRYDGAWEEWGLLDNLEDKHKFGDISEDEYKAQKKILEEQADEEMQRQKREYQDEIKSFNEKRDPKGLVAKALKQDGNFWRFK